MVGTMNAMKQLAGCNDGQEKPLVLAVPDLLT
jgi:hypothetical protein